MGIIERKARTPSEYEFTEGMPGMEKRPEEEKFHFTGQALYVPRSPDLPELKEKKYEFTGRGPHLTKDDVLYNPRYNSMKMASM